MLKELLIGIAVESTYVGGFRVDELQFIHLSGALAHSLLTISTSYVLTPYLLTD